MTKRRHKRTGAAKEPAAIYFAGMEVGNPMHQTAFLDPMPESLRNHLRGELRLGHEFGGKQWDREADRDFWVSSDGTHAVCLTLVGLNAEEAAKVRLRFDERCEVDPDICLDMDTVMQVMESVVGAIRSYEGLSRASFKVGG
jgi:hypothetical protein